MLTLSLLRHAKSSWGNAGLQDIERPLNERGLEAAPRMGAFMAGQSIAPDVVMCSPAVRTRQTLDLVLPHLSPAPAVVYEDKFYLGSASTLLRAVRRLEGGIKHAMIVAHDPGLHQLAMELSGSGDSDLLQALAQKFPTAALAVLEFRGRSWSKVKPSAGSLVHFMTPKRLP